jgi:hypothetical protein
MEIGQKFTLTKNGGGRQFFRPQDRNSKHQNFMPKWRREWGAFHEIDVNDKRDYFS